MKSSPPPSSRASALVIVLTFLVLISALVVAMLTTASNEFRSARSYQSSVTVKQLDASAVSLVLGQLADGTRSVKVPGETTGRLAWTSQPGLIRTWDDTGAGWKLFKLYSARDMVVAPDSKGFYSISSALANEVPDSWAAQPAHFSDLNAPVVVEDATGPILRGDKHFRASYPIVDPLADADGFKITAPPGYGGAAVTASLDPAQPSGPGRTGNPAPMPVRWIYVLRDGTFTVPADAAGTSAAATWTAGSTTSPSRENPIVGRIAFWADDETCKLNVNTASEPTPWDTPRAVQFHDLNFGKYQPAQKEFQRFPGHPLTVALSPVLFPGVDMNPARSDATKFAEASSRKEDIYRLLPRVQPGGSSGATVATPAAITPDDDRLFANADEFLFRADMPAITRVDLSQATDTPEIQKILSPERQRRARFFLTANSRAPEINLYGTPRISLWPVSSDPAKRTGYDKLAVFCSTIGSASASFPFCFQRAKSTSPTADYDQIPRNQQLYSYLKKLTSRTIPGYGGSFETKWGQDRDQILTEIFDYIRCVNLRDPLLVQQGLSRYADNGQVAPIKINDTKGFGRFHAISQFGIHFICAQDGPNGAPATATNPALPTGQRAIEAAILLEPFSPSYGYLGLKEAISYQVTIKTPMSVDGQDLNFPNARTTVSAVGSFSDMWFSRHFGGAQGIRSAIHRFGAGDYPLRGPDPWNAALKRAVVSAGKPTMSFSGGSVEVLVYAGTTPSAANLIQTYQVTFPPAAIPIPTLVSTGTTSTRGGIVTDPEDWWTISARYANAQYAPHAPGVEYADPKRRWFKGPKDNLPGFKAGGVFRAEDVVRTLVPKHGDIRLIAARSTVDESMFVPGTTDTSYNDTSRNLDHIFSESKGSHMIYGFGNEPGLTSPANSGTSYSQLVAVDYHYARLPEIRAGAGKLFNKWNDYDNGAGEKNDGAYINKPDEGNIGADSEYAYFSFDFTAPTETLFSPSRLIPSAGMLGSLPTGVKRGQPWETLLFRPEVRKDSSGNLHPGTVSPKDHLIMDLFWTPVVEPYAVSEPFSTAGKINLNYEIAPFSYIRRATALYGAMKAEQPLVLPHALTAGGAPLSKIYKLWDHHSNDWPYYPNDAKSQDQALGSDWGKLCAGQAPFDRLRRAIDPAKTLAQADDRFTLGDAFRSGTEICELHLVREGETLADYKSGKIWEDALITGENTRERPYTNLYGKLTTRSNTFTVHVRAQVLRQSGGPSGNEWNVWREDRNSPVAEYRGSTLVERYIDPADPNLVDFATKPDAVADRAWRTRIVSAQKFVP